MEAAKSCGTIRRAVLAGFAVLCLIGLQGIGTVGTAGAATPVWNQDAKELVLPPGADPEYPFAKLEAVSCGAPGYCSAIGTYDEAELHGQGMTAEQVAGVWQQAKKVPMPAGNEPPELRAISCSSAGNCAAVGAVDIGSESKALVVVEKEGSWQTGQILNPPSGSRWTWLSSVDCPTDGECMAIGGYEDSSNHDHPWAVAETSGSWGADLPIAVEGSPTEAFLSQIECPAVGSCEALGAIEGVEGAVASYSMGMWGEAKKLPSPTSPGTFFQSVALSCGAVGSCTVGGSYSEGSDHVPAVVNEESGNWGAVTPITPPADVNANNTASGVTAVSCPSAGSCVVVGNYVGATGFERIFSTTLSGGTWQPTAQVPVAVADEPEFPTSAYMYSLDCITVESCGAIGGAFFHGILALKEGGSWGSGAKPVVLPSNAQSPEEAGYTRAMSCGGPGACAAVGDFVDGEGMERAMVLTTEDYEAGGGGGGGGSSGGSSPTGTISTSTSSSGKPSGGGTKPFSPPKGSAGAKGSTAMVQGGSASIDLQCVGAASCSGTAKLEIHDGGSPGSSSRVVERASAGLLVIGTKPFKIGPGKKAVIRIPLTKRGKSLVASAGKKGLKAILTGAGVKKRAIVLKGK